jgi:hypothetical protein
MAVIYGWEYSKFSNAVGWSKGDQTEYEYWENFWAQKINAIVFGPGEATTNLTDAADKAAAGDVVNEMMVRTSAYLKRLATSSPTVDMYGNDMFPQFSKQQLETIKGLSIDENEIETIEMVDIGGLGASSDK